MVHNSLSEMFSALGWGSGFKLPISNALNVKLEKELEEKQRLNLKLSAELDDHSQHVDTLTNQMKRINEEMECGKRVLEVKRKAVEIERNLRAISSRTLNKAKEDRKKLCQRVVEVSNRNTVVNNEVVKRQRVIDELVGIVEFDKNALERYRESIEEKENYIAFIEQFADMDKKSIEECKKKYDKLSSVNSESNKELENTYRTTMAMQTQLDQNTHLLRRVNKERNEAMELWKSTLTSMKSRDQEMSEIAKSYADVRVAVRAVEGIVHHRKEMLESEKQGTNETNRQRTLLDKRISLLKGNFNNNKSSVHDMKETMYRISGYVKYLTHQKSVAESTIKSLDKEYLNSERKIEKSKAELEFLKEHHNVVLGASLTSEEQMKEIDSLLDQENDKMDNIIAKLERQRYSHWQRSSQRKDLKNEISVLDFSIKQMKTRIGQLKDEMSNKGEILHKRRLQIYQVDLEAFQLHTRCMRLEDPLATTNIEEIREKQGQIDKLRVELKSYEDNKVFLTQQFKHVLETGKRVMYQVRASVQDQKKLKGSISIVRMECNKCVVDTKAAIKNLRDATVDYRLIQVQLKRIKDVHQARCNTIFDMEHDRIMMRTIEKEKRVEIEVHVSMLIGNKRLLQDERSKLRTEIHEVHNVLDKLKKKYDIIMYTMDTDKDPNDKEIHTEAYYIIKRAEETEVLRREGDMWDARVKEAEQEIIALQNTLTLIFNSNHSFKDSLTPIMESSEEYAAIKQLEQDSAIALMSKNKCGRMQAKLMVDIDSTKECIQNIAKEMYALNQTCWEKNYELRSILTDVENQNTKIKRANIMSNKILKEIGPQGEHERNFIELDLKYLATKGKLEYALSTLERFVAIFPNAKTSVVEYLHLKGMKRVAARIMNARKSGTSSAASTPHRSGRDTPTCGKMKAIKSGPPSSKSGKSEPMSETNAEALQKKLQLLYSRSSKSEDENKTIVKDNEEGDENVGEMSGLNEPTGLSIDEIEENKISEDIDVVELNSPVDTVDSGEDCVFQEN